MTQYISIGFDQRSRLDAAGSPFRLESGAIGGQQALRNATVGNVLVVRVPGLVLQDNGGQYQHEFTCHRRGAVVIPFNPQNGKVGLTAINRPVVPRDKVETYVAAWDAHIERPDVRFSDFGNELFPMLGKDTYQFPQGYGLAGESADDNALRVLKLQGGFDSPVLLQQLEGYVVIDPGNRVAPVPFYIAHVDPSTRRLDPTLPALIWKDEQEYFALCKGGWVISDSPAPVTVSSGKTGCGNPNFSCQRSPGTRCESSGFAVLLSQN